jgi:hypothetical protein
VRSLPPFERRVAQGISGTSPLPASTPLPLATNLPPALEPLPPRSARVFDKHFVRCDDDRRGGPQVSKAARRRWWHDRYGQRDVLWAYVLAFAIIILVAFAAFYFFD